MILHTLHNLLHLMQLHRLTAASCPPIVLSPELAAWHAFEHFALAQNGDSTWYTQTVIITAQHTV
jgi:hypothetical protein